jgi:hypothetical protein
MNLEVKNSFVSGLNLDDSVFALKKDAYIDGLNITRDAVAGNQDMVITNVRGNQLVSYGLPKKYANPTYGMELFIVDNGDGTQTATISFDVNTFPVGAIVNKLNYNGTPVVIGLTSPESITIPKGDYTYTFTFGIPLNPLTVPITSTPTVSKCIGAYPNTLRDTVVYFIYNDADYHLILEYNNTTRAIVPILQNIIQTDGVDILGFTENEKITSICIYNRDEGDLLFFLDSLGRPTGLDITQFKAGAYVPATRTIIDAGKRPPLSPPSYTYSNDTTHRSNNLLNTFFRFKQRWVYDNNAKSSWSPISQVNIPTSILDDTFTNVITNNNLIVVSLDSGDKEVKGIEIAMSYAHKANEWVDFSLVEFLDKSKLSIGDDTTFSYSFYNDSAYPLLDQTDSNSLFYYIPDKANAMILANGNVLVMGGITEGYDRDLTANVVTTVLTYPLSGSSGSGSLNGTIYNLSTGTTTVAAPYILFGGTPATGTQINIKLKAYPSNTITTVATYTTVAGDTIGGTGSGVLGGLITSGIGLGFLLQIKVRNTNELQLSWRGESNASTPRFASNYLTLEIVPPTTSTTSNSLGTWKWSTSRRIGIAYYDQKGKTNGVLYDAKVVFPAYAEDGSHNVILPYINVKVYHTPPNWAYSYQFVITKEPTTYLFWETVSVNTTETDYIYFEVTNFTVNAKKTPTTSTVLSYSFQDGDRVRLIKRVSDQNVFGDTYDTAILGLLNEPTISGVVQTGKQFLKIKKIAPFSTVAYTGGLFVIEIYRPARKIGDAENEVFYEFGQEFPIINPTETTRAHSGNVTNQDQSLAIPAETNLYQGDSYFRQRNIYLTDTGSATLGVQDRNIVDNYISAVSSIDGRPSIIDINAKRQYFGNLIRFGQAYQANTNINGLNAFYAGDFEEVDYSLGSVRRMSTRERFIRVFQDYKIGMMPLFSQINKSTSGDVVVQTDRLLNPIQYYTGNFGIGTASESLYSFNNADYGVDNNRGVFWRVSNDGVTPISILYKINSWATDHLPLRKGNYKVYGGFDPKANNYIAALEATSGENAYTLTFDEQSNAFESFLSCHPEMMVTLGTLLISFKDGSLYTHDNENYNTFYGTVYESNITLVFNEKALERKTWLGLNEVSSDKWDCPLIYSNVISYGSQRQETNLLEGEFTALESTFAAPIKRDTWSRGGKVNGGIMKGNYLAVKFRKQNAINLITLNLISAKFIPSQLSV